MASGQSCGEPQNVRRPPRRASRRSTGRRLPPRTGCGAARPGRARCDTGCRWCPGIRRPAGGRTGRLPAASTSGIVVEQFLGAQQNVVEIDGAGVLQRLLVAAVGHGRQMLFVGLGPGGRLGGPDAVRFPAADVIQQVARPQRLARPRGSRAARVRAMLSWSPRS